MGARRKKDRLQTSTRKLLDMFIILVVVVMV